MALTIIPQVWSDWVTTEMLNVSNIVLSPYVEFDPIGRRIEKDILMRIPKFKSLDILGDDEVITSSTTLSPSALEDYSELAPIVRRGKAVAVTDVEIQERGVDPLTLLAPQIAQRNLKQMQKVLKAVIDGVFAGPLATSHTYDISGAADPKIDAGPIEDALQTILGEVGSNFNAMIMHSKVAADLKKKGLTYTAFAPTYTDGLITNGEILTYWGKKIIVNDTICAPFGTQPKYPTYLIAGTPFYIGWQKELTINNQFNPAVGGGRNEIYWYAHYAVGMRGVSFTAGINNPTNTQLALATSWTKVAPDDKLIPIVRLVTL
jgi:hypothetical protein